MRVKDLISLLKLQEQDGRVVIPAYSGYNDIQGLALVTLRIATSTNSYWGVHENLESLDGGGNVEIAITLVSENPGEDHA